MKRTAALTLLAALGTNSCSGEDSTFVAVPQPLSECSLAAASGPYWLSEGETLELQFDCRTDVDIADREVAVTGLPSEALYEYDSAKGLFSWTPQLDEAGVYQLGVGLPETGEQLELIVGVADRHDDPHNRPVRNHRRYTHEYGLPVVFLDSAPTESVYGRSELTFRGHFYRIEAKLRGSSSLNYPKRNYTLEFDNDDLFDAPDVGMGFVDRKKMVLTSTFDDNAYVRQRLAFELWNRMDPEHIQIHAASVVLYVDGVYHGLYTLSDHVDRHLMRAHGMLDSGNLYKARSYDAKFKVGAEPLHLGLTKAEGLPVDDFTDLWSFITFIDTASDEEFDARAPEVIELREYRDWWVFAAIIRADDSVSKNSYHYIEYPGAPARYVPWDFNASFGQTWKTLRVNTDDVRTYGNHNRIFERLFSNPEQTALLRERCLASLDGVFSVENVEATLDDYLAEIEPSARRDWAKWETAYRSFSRWRERTDFRGFDDEVAYVREWYRGRWSALRAWCSALESGEADESTRSEDSSTSGSKDSGSGS